MSRLLVLTNYADLHQEHKLLSSRKVLTEHMKAAKLNPEIENIMVYKDPTILDIWVNPIAVPNRNSSENHN